MDKPEMYSRNGADLVVTAAKYVDQLWPLLTWPEPPLPALDIGCGPGDIASKVLAPRLPPGTKLVACDISPEMVEFGRQHNSLTGAITFERLDLLEPDLENSAVWQYTPFGKVFAFMLMHWVPDTRRGVQNVHKLLSIGGEAIFTMIANTGLLAAYEEMAKDPRWAQYTQDVEKFVPPYQHSEDPANEFRRLLQSEGFQVLRCDLSPHSFVCASEAERRDLLTSVCPFVNRVPEDLKDDFIDDWIQCAEKLKGLSKDAEGPKCYIDIASLVVAARKL
ncbi:juvenile hormone acid O-methyltransferase-like [Schistocerca serialis cubense]|uniref:juvenile hormone acid O-methyltransferase-like n=1 Tax=Schistocerca serialis cubense TaxID=2023355 RepID=UPI00214EC5F8|nr:juvenile hormone acid O-methyltransferase-like [Schistocerca serialis cubense]